MRHFAYVVDLLGRQVMLVFVEVVGIQVELSYYIGSNKQQILMISNYMYFQEFICEH